MKNIRTFTFQYDPTISLERTFAKMQEAAKTGKSSVHPHRIKVANLEALWLNSDQLKLFSCLVDEKPNSLTELAQALQKDYVSVLREAQILEGMGIIELQKPSEDAGMKQTKPIPLYDRIVFDFSARKEKGYPRTALNAL